MTSTSDRVALVTGGTSGIGAAVAARLLASGYQVTAAGLVADLDEGTAEALRGATVVDLDVRDESAVAAVVADTVVRGGGLDVLVTAAGVQRYGTAVDTTVEEWEDTFAVNVRGVFLAIRHAVPAMRRRGGGAVVAVTSVQAFVVQDGVAAYAAGKAAVNGLIRSVAVDEAPHRIRANAVCPGSVDTPMLRAAAERFADDATDPAELVREWGRMHPWGRVARAEEVASAVCWLADPASSFVTGTALPVDGGLLVRAPVSLP